MTKKFMHYVSSEFPNAQVGEVARVGWAYRCYVCRVASVCLYFLGSSSELEIHLAVVPQPPTATLVSFCLSSTFQRSSDVLDRYLQRTVATFWLMMRAQMFLHSSKSFRGALPSSRINVCQESVYAWYVTLFTQHQVYPQ